MTGPIKRGNVDTDVLREDDVERHGEKMLIYMPRGDAGTGPSLTALWRAALRMTPCLLASRVSSGRKGVCEVQMLLM